jgi:hypothetical protein
VCVYVGNKDYIYTKFNIVLSEALIREYVFGYSLLYILFLANILIIILRVLKRF